MNKSYRIVWNHVRNCLMVVSEATKSRGKGAASKAVVETVAAALMALGVANAMATAITVPGTYASPYGSTISLANGDSLSILNNGTVALGGYLNPAINVNGVNNIGFISNSGSISIARHTNAPAVLLRNATVVGGVYNSGTIIATPAIAISNSTVAGGISNTGVLSYSDGQGYGLAIANASIASGIVNSGNIYKLTIKTGSTVTGGIVNSASGLIAEQLSLTNASLSGGILNQGRIYWSLGLISSQVSGDINNTGSIEGGVGPAVSISGSTILGSFINDRLINSMTSDAIRVVAGSTISGAIVNSGTINAGTRRNTTPTVGALVISQSSVGGGIVNSGLITLSGSNNPGAGIYINQATVSGTVSNSNLIAAQRGSGLYINTVSGLTGIYNTGTISSNGGGADSYGIYVNNAVGLSTISNSGTIYSQLGYYGGGAALFVANQAAPLLINNTGSINAFSGAAASVSISGVADLTFSNSGYIGMAGYSGPALQIANSTVTGVIASSGTISGDVKFISSMIRDAMTVVGSFGGGISLSQSGFSGSIRNLGTIQSAFTVINGSIAGDFVNDARVTAVQIISSTVQGAIINTHQIADQYGSGNITIRASSVAGGITNSGYIGTINLQNFDNQFNAGVGYTLGGAISNSGTIGSVNIGSGLLAGLVNAPSGQINQGLLIKYNAPTSSVFPRAAASISGAIVNYGTISGGWVSGGGFTIQSNATVSGSILNAGSISRINFGTANMSSWNLASKIESGITNTGVIGFGTNAMFMGGGFQVQGGISNTGLITASGTALLGLRADIDQLINDVSGTISGGAYAIRFGNTTGYPNGTTTLSGSLVNSGLIKATAGQAIVLYGSTIGGSVVNNTTGTIQGLTAINLVNASIGGGITNSGLIFGTAGSAITTSGTTVFTLVNSVSGTIVGAINGQLNVSNSGLLALQTSTGLQTGSTVASIINGNYYQASTGQLRIGVTGSSAQGTISGNYSTLSVSGTAQFAGTGKIFVDFASGSQAIQPGQIISSVLTAGSLVGSSFSILDNSAVVNFQWQTSAGTLSLVAVSSVIICGSTVTGAQTGPCEMDASNYPNLTVTSLGSISGGSQGVNVLAANITGRLMNSGSILGNSMGVQFMSGATLSGGITNTGLISGAVGVLYNASVSGGTIDNSGSIIGSSGAGVSIAGSAQVSSIQNTGYISSVNNAGVLGNLVNSGSLISVANSGNLNGLTNNSSLTSLNNSGTLASLVQAGGTLSGVTNSGLMNGATAVGVTGGLLSSLTNTGSITGSSVGVAVASGATLAGLNNTGYINSLNNAGVVSNLVQAGGTLSGVTNSGLMNGATAVGVTGGLLSSLTNTGSITGSSVGVAIASAGTVAGLNNQGAINSINNAGLLTTLNNSGTVTSLVNSGSVSSLINTASLATLSNTGTITSLSNTGGTIAGLTSSGAITAVNNSGQISGMNLGANSQVANGITNTGLIGGSAVAINASGSAVTLLNQSAGTVVGAINGNLDVSNSGIIALQTSYNGTTYAGSPVNASISGNYSQGSAGTLQFAVTSSGAYSALTVGGAANFAANSNINVVLNSASAVSSGQTLAGVITAGSLVTNGLTIIDNSALIGFRYQTVSGVLSLVAYNTPNCGSIVGGAQVGPCEVGVGIPSLTVTGLGAITGGTQGINVLAANLTGRIINQGLVQGTATGISFVAGGTLSSGITNSGTIQGLSTHGIAINQASLGGGITNSAGASISGLQNGVILSGSTLSGGLTNSGIISGTSFAGVMITSSGVVASIGGISNQSTGTISGPGYAVYLGDSGLSGGLTNAGLLTATGNLGYAFRVENSSISGGVVNTGNIYGASGGGAVSLMQAGSIIGGLVNSGTLNGVFSVTDASLISGGFTNSGYMSGGTALYMKNNALLQGGLSNSGSIIGVSSYAITVQNGSTIVGINNTSLIQGQNTGIALMGSAVQGGLTNSGSIIGVTGLGVLINSSALVSGVLNNSGYINGVNNAGSIGGLENYTGVIAGGIVNSGTISRDQLAVHMYHGSLSGGFTNTGLIEATASFAGMQLYATTLTGNLANLGGTILGGLGGSAALSLTNSSLITGVLSNTGMISGQVGVEVYASQVTGGITNSGSIVGTSGAGVEVGANTTLSGLNNTGYISSVSNAGFIATINNVGGTIAGGVTNAGLIYSASGSSITTSGSTMMIANLLSGTVAGAFGGDLSVSNSGLIALQTMAGGTISAGTSLSAAITGDYTQAASGTLQFGVNGLSGTGTIAGNYSTLTVGGTATFATNSKIKVSMSSATAVQQGQSLAGLVSAASLVSNGFTITDNSALVDFTYVTTSGVLTLVATAPAALACGTVSSGISGPCLMAFNAANVLVTGLGTVSGATTGVRVLSGVIAGGLVNQGSILGTAYGVVVNQGATTISGGFSNTGMIQGTQAGILMSNTSVGGGLNNASTGTVMGAVGLSLVSGSTLAGGLTNAGLITSGLSLSASSIQNGFANMGGTVTGGNQGLNMQLASILSGGLTNTGLLNGTVVGVGVGAGSVLTGGLNNQGGTISGGTQGVVFSQSTLVGGLTNTGYITGMAGVGVYFASSSVTGSIVNSAGTMTGAQYGLSLNNATITGNVSNSGYLQATTYAGLSVGLSSLSGAVINQSGGSISGYYGINANGSTIGGGITNTGMVQGTYSGLSLVNANVTNGVSNLSGGSITGGTLGMFVSAAQIAGGLNNAVNATISGASFGLQVTAGGVIGGGVTNAGLITGPSGVGVGVAGASTINGGLNNQALATISGSVTGLSVSANSVVIGGLTNAGLITGGTYAINGPGLSSILTNGANAQFVGTVSAVNASLNVSSGTLTAVNGIVVNSVTVTSGSMLNLVTSNSSTLSGGITAANGVTNAGVVNVGMANATVSGNYAQTANGVLRIGALGSNNHGSLNVTGVASFAPNASIYITTITGATFANGSILSGLVNAGSLSATTFSVTSNSALLSFTATVVGNSVGVTASTVNNTSIPTAVASQGNTAGTGAANSLNTVFTSYVAGSSTYASMNNAMAAFANMSSNSQISQAVSQSLPVLSSNSPVQTLAVLTAINQSIEARSLKLRGVSSGHEMYGNNNVWMKPFGSWMNQGNMNGAYGFKANAGGLMLGADHQWDDKARIGGAFAWGNSSANSNMGGQNQTSNMYQFVGYGAYAVTPSVNVNMQANGGWNNNTTNRNIGFLGTSAQASYDSAVWHAGVGVDRPTKLSEDTTFIPQARFDYTWIRNQSYNETGASDGMGLNVGSQTYQTSVLGVDGKVQHKLSDHNMVSANLGVGYNFSPTQTWVAASYQGASALQFTTTGVNPSAVSARAGLGYTYKVKEGVDVGVRYDIDVQEKYTNQIATAKARWNF